MDRRSWLWRRKSSEKSPGETESSGSVSSHSERFSDEQEGSRVSANDTQSPEVSSNPSGGEPNDNEKTLTEKLSAALLNIRAKEDLVKQHAKVAEEAVTGWEKAEKEAAALKLKLEATIQKNSALEDRIGHLDGALKECVRQLRQAREEQEQKIHEAIEKKNQEIESSKLEFENQLSVLQSRLEAAKVEAISMPSVDFDVNAKLETSEKENSALRLELIRQSEELKFRTLERDLSTQTAEAASKQHLESIKKVAKLEAECRRLRAMTRKSSPLVNEHRQVSSVCLESLTDSQSDSGDGFNQLEADVSKMSGMESNECGVSGSDTWASALIAELDQFRNDKVNNKNLVASSVEFGLMDDFLEMERLVALPDTQADNNECQVGVLIQQLDSRKTSPSKPEQLEILVQRTSELEGKLHGLEEEKAVLEKALAETQDQLNESRALLTESEEKVMKLERELNLAKDLYNAREVELENITTRMNMVQLQLGAADAEAQALRMQVGSLEMDIEQEKAFSESIKVKCHDLEVEIEQERALSGEIRSKCENLEVEIKQERSLSTELKAKYSDLEDEILRKRDAEIHMVATANGELKVKQEKELAVAAGKLAECQKTIASLGRQLKSLASLEDFLLDPEMPELNGVSLTPKGETKSSFSSAERYFSKGNSLKLAGGSSSVLNGKEESPPSSSTSHGVEKSRNGIGKLFSRSRSSTTAMESM